MNTDDILNQRGTTHGEYAHHAAYTQAIKRCMSCTKNWDRLSDMQRETLDMIAHKIGRILAGNPGHHDHWADIAGYARLVEQRLPVPAAVPDPLPTPYPPELVNRAPHPRDATLYRQPIGPKPDEPAPPLYRAAEPVEKPRVGGAPPTVGDLSTLRAAMKRAETAG